MAIPDPNAPPLSPYEQDMTQWQRINPMRATLEALKARQGQPAQPMYTPEQAQQRTDANRQEYDLGMLSALSSDEGMRNVGGMLFKSALAARQPKVTERGVFDPITGKYTYNPGYQDEKLQAQIVSAQEQEARLQNQFLEGRQKARESDQRQADSIQARRELAAIAAGARGDTQAQLAAQRTATMEDHLRKDLEGQTKSLQDELTATGNLKSLITGYAGVKPDPMGQQAIIMLFNKFLDPHSVVREGEFNRVAQAGGLFTRAQVMLGKVARGDLMTPDMISQIQKIAQIYEDASNAKGRVIASQYADVAGRRGLDVRNVITNANWLPQAAPAKPPGPAPAPQPSPAAQARDAERQRLQATLQASQPSVVRQPQQPQPGGVQLFTDSYKGASPWQP